MSDTDRECGGTVAFIGVTTTWSAQPAEYSDDSMTLYMKGSVSLFMTYRDLLALMPATSSPTCHTLSTDKQQ